jgi:hypothetical protein
MLARFGHYEDKVAQSRLLVKYFVMQSKMKRGGSGVILRLYIAREIPRPAGENAGLRDDAGGVVIIED